MRRGLLALALALWAGAAGAQVQTDAAGLREIAARLLSQGEAERAGELARALLARDPRDAQALLLLGRAGIEMGDWEAALGAARQAHGLSEGRNRYLAARIAARAHAELGHWTRAQVWLRRASGDAPDEAALEDLAQEFRAVRSLNPLSVTLGFGAAPSSNVNGGSSSETITIPGFDFPLPLSPEARALSGLRLSGSVGLSYRLRRSETSATFLELDADGRTYLLSPEARAEAPNAQGSDFSDASATGTLVHRWQREGDSGPSALRITRGQTWYDGERYTEIGQLGFDRSFALSELDRLDLSAWGDWTRRRNERTARLFDPVTGKPLLDPVTGDPVTVDIVTHDEWWTLGLRGRWTHRLDWGDRANLSVTLRDSQGEVADATYTGVGLGAGYDWAEPVAGLRLGAGLDLDWRQFDRSRYVAEDRGDLRATLRGTAGLTRFDFWGLEPTVRIEASRTESNVDRMDRNTVTLDLSLRSTF